MKLEILGYTVTIEKKALEDKKLPEDLQEALKILQKYGYKSPVSKKKQLAAHKATLARQNAVKRKIADAINILRLEQQEITPYRVAKTAGVSYNTAKKYLKV